MNSLYLSLIQRHESQLKDSSQLIVVKNNEASLIITEMDVLEKKDGNWVFLFEKIPSGIGKKGFAMIDEKKEGDKKTPSGIYPLSLVFGYDEKTETKMPYRQATENDFWVDDVDSEFYNQWVRGVPDAKSYEKMKRNDHQYKYGIVVQYNENPVVKGKGSAIFMHIWREQGAGSAGCITMNEETILKIIRWLDPAKKPHIILGTEEILKNL
ncbi:MAG: hypothetical protein A2Y41_00315 [Spirochaetes bacterium GWB1_36_13]|nr:MAG: hypothetical protein A2Y41_00315 [Spirochaetes bacterium GWB1_36_13]